MLEISHVDTPTIRTNKVPRFTLDWRDLTTKEQAEFDYLETEQQEEGSFFRFKGNVYDLGECMRLSDGSVYGKYWHGYYGESAFSAVLVHLCGDSDRVVIGQAFS